MAKIYEARKKRRDMVVWSHVWSDVVHAWHVGGERNPFEEGSCHTMSLVQLAGGAVIAGGALLYLRRRGVAAADPHLYCAPELLAKDLSGSTICITGGNSGFGKMVAEQLVGQGGHVVIACRNMQAGEVVAAELCAKGPGTCTAMELDLASLDSVRRFAAAYQAAYSRLDVHIEK